MPTPRQNPILLPQYPNPKFLKPHPLLELWVGSLLDQDTKVLTFVGATRRFSFYRERAGPVRISPQAAPWGKRRYANGRRRDAGYEPRRMRSPIASANWPVRDDWREPDRAAHLEGRTPAPSEGRLFARHGRAALLDQRDKLDPAALIWLANIGMDRTLGFGLR